MRELRTWTIAAVLSIVVGVGVGCGDGDGDGDGDTGALGDSECELAVSLAGGLAWESAEAPACVIPFGGDEGIRMIYHPVDGGPVEAVEVDVMEVMEGELGPFPASVTIRADDGRAWTSDDCVVDIATHDYVGEDDFSREYLVTGTGECASPAAPRDGGAAAEVTITDLEFRFPASW